VLPKKLGVTALTQRLLQLPSSERVTQFIKFCGVGVSGMVVDMGVLYLLADPKSLGLNIAFSKLCAAEIALMNNFVWNEVWTFRCSGETIIDIQRGACRSSTRRFRRNPSGPIGSDAPYLRSLRLRRFLFFNAICGVGIVFAISLLHLFHSVLAWNLYLSNLLTICCVTLWNFGMNARFNWHAAGAKGHDSNGH
jgi:dolichol-phosphate mannosyltransferase